MAKDATEEQASYQQMAENKKQMDTQVKIVAITTNEKLSQRKGNT
jgi:hypothetical protein